MEAYLDSEKQTVDEFEAELEKRVRDAVAAQFVLDQVAKREEIGVEQQELTEHMLRRAQQSGQNPQEYVQHMVEHNHIPELVSEVAVARPSRSSSSRPRSPTSPGNHVELKNLRPTAPSASREAVDADAADEEEAVEAAAEEAAEES